MKKILQKVTNKMRPDESFYTWSHWKLKIVDGNTFIPVMKSYPTGSYGQIVHYINAKNVNITAVSTVESTLSS